MVVKDGPGSAVLSLCLDGEFVIRGRLLVGLRRVRGRGYSLSTRVFFDVMEEASRQATFCGFGSFNFACFFRFLRLI